MQIKYSQQRIQQVQTWPMLTLWLTLRDPLCLISLSLTFPGGREHGAAHFENDQRWLIDARVKALNAFPR